MEYAEWLGELEVRQVGGAQQIVGRFPYGSLGTVSDRGSVRKERIAPGAFRYAIADTSRRIDLLVGHDFGKPIASRQSGTLEISESSEAVTFSATLPTEGLAPSWVVDAELAIRNGTMTGLSPGFRVPPRAVVPNAEVLIAEPGNPGVMIRQVNDAVLREFSVVTSGVYLDAGVDLRAEDFNAVLFLPRSIYQWL